MTSRSTRSAGAVDAVQSASVQDSTEPEEFEDSGQTSSRRARTTIRVPADEVPRSSQVPLAVPDEPWRALKSEGSSPMEGSAQDTQVDHDIRDLESDASSARSPSLADYGLSLEEEDPDEIEDPVALVSLDDHETDSILDEVATGAVDDVTDVADPSEAHYTIQIDIGDDDELHTKPNQNDREPTLPIGMPSSGAQDGSDEPDISSRLAATAVPAQLEADFQEDPTTAPRAVEAPRGNLDTGLQFEAQSRAKSTQGLALDSPTQDAVAHASAAPAQVATAFTDHDRTTQVTSAPAAAPRYWWEDFFDDDYLQTVRVPTDEQIQRQCDFLERALGLDPGASILDVGCGLGLQSVELSSRGYNLVGMDLSLPMLTRAADEAQQRNQKIHLIHGDMNAMSFRGVFDAMICIGTTFGYFDEETNRQLVRKFHDALKPLGLLLIEVVNRDYVIRDQPTLTWFEGDGCLCMEETNFQYLTSRLHVKRTVMLEDGRQKEADYSMRLYSFHELGVLLHQSGFRVVEVSGREATPGVFFGQDSSKLIILAERRS